MSATTTTTTTMTTTTNTSPPVEDVASSWESFLAAERKRFREAMLQGGESTQPRSPKLLGAKCSDFFFYQVLGRGGFGEVRLLRHKGAHTWHAAKILLKSMVISRGHVSHVNSERAILALCQMAFIVQLNYAFQDATRLYLVMEFVPGGDLFTMLRHIKRFDERLARFFGGQVLLALEYLHRLQIIHRDVKPENIMLTHNGYLKLVDFGFAKLVTGRTYTFCGTPEYLAPEILLHRGYGPSVDWWAFGILLFEMVVGRSPFVCQDVANTYAKILDRRLSPRDAMANTGSEGIRDLIGHLLQREVSQRFGSLAREGPREIRRHAWFAEVDWDLLFHQKVVPPYEYAAATPHTETSTKEASSAVPEHHLAFFGDFC